MFLRFLWCLVAAAILFPHHVQASACSQKMQELALQMRGTDLATSKYNRLLSKIEKSKRSPRLFAEACRIAKALAPRLATQLAELKQSGCTREAETAAMMSDIMRSHEDDLASTRKFMASGCH